MKKVLLSILAIAMLLSLVACGTKAENGSGGDTPAPNKTVYGDLDNIKSRGKLVVVTSPDWAPYEFLDISKGSGDDALAGFEIAIARHIASELGVKVEFQQMDFDACLAALANGQCDMGASSFAPTEKRKLQMSFSDEFYDGGVQTIIIRKEDMDKYKTPADFNGVKIGVQHGSLQETIAKAEMPNAKIELVTKVTDGILQLQSKQIDGLVIGEAIGDNFAKRNPELYVTKIDLPAETDGITMAFPKENTNALIEEVNRIIANITPEMKKQWMDEAVTIAAENEF